MQKVYINLINENSLPFSSKLTVLKRGASILLLLLLAFNWVGYRLLTSLWENNADLALETKIENSDYDESSLFEIRVPLNAPYLTGTNTDFERYDGELELQGIHYKYVKRKIENGELVLLCLPNKSKNEIQNSRAEFFKLVNDLNNTQSKNKTGNSSFKSVTTEYKKENNSWSISSIPLMYLTHTAAYLSEIATGFGNLPEHPPKA